MRNTMMSKSELDFEAPLAQFEETDEYLIEATKCRKDCENNNLLTIPTTKKSCLITHLDNNNLNNNCQEKLDNCKNIITNLSLANNEDTFTETISGSLEDLVNTFDEKITKCFGNYEESVENLAPVQIRTQEEIMDDCQMWWTITGNFGNILPIDWSKTYTRKMHLPSLNLNTNSKKTNESFDTISSEEEENITNDLDMHTLILSGIQAETEPIKTAEEVLQEIDDMIMEDTLSDVSPINEVFEKGRDILRCPLQDEKLALRDELEYEKELKNSFISLLLSVQSKRRHYYVEKKKLIKNNTNNNQLNMTNRTTNDMSYIIESKYLTTVIPYNLNNGPPNNQGLQVLIKILKAINEDSPTVPTLLTDYILKDYQKYKAQKKAEENKKKNEKDKQTAEHQLQNEKME